MIGGKATKRSRYGFKIEEQIRGTIEATKIIRDAGLKIHIIDAEWRPNDVSPSEFEELLSSFPDVKIFVTVAARRRDSIQLLKLYAPIIEEFGNAGLCIVAGNNAYLDFDEVTRSPCESVKLALSEVYGRTSRLLLGVEGLEKCLDNLIKAYPDVKLFFLYDEHKLDVMRSYAERGFECAVYVPYVIEHDSNYVARELMGYALRRKWLRREIEKLGYQASMLINSSEIPGEIMKILEHSIPKLCIHGPKKEVVRKLKILEAYGASMVIGLPIKESLEQVYAFSECLKQL